MNSFLSPVQVSSLLPPKTQARLRCGLLSCLLAILLSIAAPVFPGVGSESSLPSYDITVLVLVQGTGSAAVSGQPKRSADTISRGLARERVALSYSRAISHDRLRQGIARLASRTGSRIRNLAVVDGPLTRGSRVPCTAAEFALVPKMTVSRPVPLPVEPIITSLPDWARMRLVFVVGEGLTVSIPDTTMAEGFSVHLVRSGDVYEYDVVSMRGSATGFHPRKAVPPVESRETSLPVRASSRKMARLALILASAAAGAVAIWLLLARKGAGRGLPGQRETDEKLAIPNSDGSKGNGT